MYSLYGIVEHSGKLSAGHYTAFVKVARPPSSHIVTFKLHKLLHCTLLYINLQV